MRKPSPKTDFVLRLEGLSAEALGWLKANPELAQQVVSRALSEASMVSKALDTGRAKPGATSMKKDTVRRLLDTGAFNESAHSNDGITPEFLKSIPSRLRPFLVPPLRATEEEKFLSARAASDQLDVAPATIISWIEKGQLLGFRSAGKNYLVPAEQIRGSRRVTPGIAQVIQQFSCHEEAWDFLNQPQENSDKAEGKRPMDLLNDGELELVLELAAAYTDGYD